jgi:hypothetical protein
MPLTGSNAVLSAALRAGLLGNGDSLAVDNAALTALCDVIAEQVLAHIVANAVLVVPATGILAPSGAAGGPCTGAAAGTIT